MSRKQALVFLLVSLLACGALGFGPRHRRFGEGQSQRERFRMVRGQQCQLDRISSTAPTERIESDGGVMEFWDQDMDQFQCVGFAPMRITIQPNSLSLPKYFPAPRLIFIEQGRGVFGITYPGCPETYHTEQQLSRSSRGSGFGAQTGDMHQKVHRVRRGDIIAVPHGAAHWCYNDGNEELVAVSVIDLNNPHNQLDQNLRAFMLAGGQPRQEQQRFSRERMRRGSSKTGVRVSQRPQETFQNVFSSFDTELMAEAFNVPTNVIRQMQQTDNFRGVIVKCDEEMRFVVPDEEEDEFERQGRMSRPRYSSRRGGRRYANKDDDEDNEAESEFEEASNGFEESSFCNMKFKQNMELRLESDVHTREAGRIHIVNEQKLPMLRFLDLSAERGHLMPNAMYTPHWSMTDHRALYALRGELRVQVVDDKGESIMDEVVRQGEMFVIPQFYTSLMRAGGEGFEWVSFKTSSQPMKNQMAGYTSVIRAMPIDVISSAYQCSPREALQLKVNRDPQSMIFSPMRRTPSS